MSELKYPLKFCKEIDDCNECKFTYFGESEICNFDATSYKQGIADLLMPYDVESIEELIGNVKKKARADERRNVLQWVLNNFSDCEGICDIDICRKYSKCECIDALMETYEEKLKEQKNE